MENPEIFVYLLIGVVLGGVIGWLAGSRKGARAEAESRAAEQRLEEGGDVSEEDAKALTQAILYSQAQIKAKRRKRG